MAQSQVAQDKALYLAVGDVADDGQGLGEQVDGLPVVTQAKVAVLQVAQRDARALGVASVAVKGQRLSMQVDG